jgi:MoaA/NifB/PqqE/SkfB family radical SAM enzyme
MAVSIGDYLVRQRIKHLIVHVTNACNFRCAHCFIDFAQSKRDLKLEQFLQLASETPPLLWLDIGGGEPFLRKDLAEIVCAFESEVVHIPTNGSLIPQMIETLNKIRARSTREVMIGLSLDGLRETHDRIRKQPGSFEQVWEAYAALRKVRGISVKITTVINNHNVDDILPLMEEVAARGADFHSVILLRGHTAEPDVRLPSIAQLRELAPRMFEILGRYDYGRPRVSAYILRNYHRFLWKTSLAILEQQTQVIPCLAGRAHLVVNGDGGVSSCEMLPAIGNLKESSLQDLLHSDHLRAQVQSIRDKQCHCTHNCAMLDSTFFNPRNLPQLLYQGSG